MRKLSRYWICQLGGWGVNWAISIFFYLTLSVRKIDHFFFLMAISVLLGVLVSHLMRMVIHRQRFLEKSLQGQISSFIGVTILFAMLYACLDVSATQLLGLKDNSSPELSLINQLARNTINSFFILLIWNLIYYTYHYVERNRKQELNTLRLQSLVKELELKTIKSHINPHFIFNALNSIRALVDENPVRARTAITELSNILRSSMQAEKLETVSLEKELGIVNDYLALEKMRFEERLLIEMEIDPQTLQRPVPPMMLQTLVENAIKHGISRQVKGGRVRILSRYAGNHLELLVQNSGQLNGFISQDGFGIRSTQDRLNLLYQGRATFHIRNVDAETVESRIVMPLNNQ